MRRQCGKIEIEPKWNVDAKKNGLDFGLKEYRNRTKVECR